MPDFKQEAIAPIQFANPVEQYQNLLKAQYLSTEIEKARRLEDEAAGTADAYKNALAVSKNPDGTLDRNKFRAAAKEHLITNNRGQLVPAFEKGNAEVDKIEAQTAGVKAQQAKTEMEGLKLTLQNMAEQYKSVSLDDPALAQQQLYALEKGFAVDPALAKFNAAHGITPEQYLERRVAEMQPHAQDPNKMREYVIRQMMGAKDAQSALEQKLQVVDGGDHNDIYRTDKNGKLEKIQTTPKKMADHSTRIVVNANQKAANAFGEKLGQHEADSYSNLEELSRGAPEAITELDRMINAVASGKVITGLGVNQKLDALRALKLAKGQLSPQDEELLANTQEFQKYIANNLLSRTAQLNKAGLGAKTSVQELRIMEQAIARGNMEPAAILKVLLNQRKDIQNAIPKFNQRQLDVHNSPDLDPIQRTLASHPLDEIPDHPLYEHIVGKPNGAPAGKKYPAPSPAAIQLLRAGKISKETFDDPEHYGPGAAARAMSGK
jgi:hypothetical protein